MAPDSSPLSFPEDMFNSFANRDRLSRREPDDPDLRKTDSRAKYPSVLPLGGDAHTGLAMEL